MNSSFGSGNRAFGRRLTRRKDGQFVREWVVFGNLLRLLGRAAQKVVMRNTDDPMGFSVVFVTVRPRPWRCSNAWAGLGMP